MDQTWNYRTRERRISIKPPKHTPLIPREDHIHPAHLLMCWSSLSFFLPIFNFCTLEPVILQPSILVCHLERSWSSLPFSHGVWRRVWRHNGRHRVGGTVRMVAAVWSFDPSSPFKEGEKWNFYMRNRLFMLVALAAFCRVHPVSRAVPTFGRPVVAVDLACKKERKPIMSN